MKCLYMYKVTLSVTIDVFSDLWKLKCFLSFNKTYIYIQTGATFFNCLTLKTSFRICHLRFNIPHHKKWYNFNIKYLKLFYYTSAYFFYCIRVIKHFCWFLENRRKQTESLQNGRLIRWTDTHPFKILSNFC